MLLKLGDEKNENGYALAVITEQEKCVGCAVCAAMCPAMAIDVYSRQRNELTGKMNRSFVIYSRMLSRLKK
jgi:formate hydrogenlyase subunit 6/NADH:ubiquinone oxidoreductase subunit I